MEFFKKKYITRGDGLKYLIRYNLFECRFFSIKIHKILASDDECLHDHPWGFISFILAGGYVEYSQVKHEEIVNCLGDIYHKYTNTSKLYGRFSLLYRPANYIHKLEIHQPATTLVITFKKVRQWGFWTPYGFVKWYRYRYTGNRCE